MNRQLNTGRPLRRRIVTGLVAALVWSAVVVATDGSPDDAPQPPPSNGSELRVIASIRPVHSLVSSVMHGVGEPELLVDGNASPHTFSLKPSSARMLQDADVVFWIGVELETFLERPLLTLASEGAHVALAESLSGKADEHEAVTAPDKQGEPAGHPEGAEHLDDDQHAEQGLPEGQVAALHDDHLLHRHAADAHIWLNPDRAIDMLDVIARQLAELDPDNAGRYLHNAETASDAIRQLASSIEQQLSPVLDTPYIVFHDAYGAFEKRFSITRSIPFLLNPEARSGADRIQRLRSIVQEQDVQCLFTEPQFDVAMADVIAEGSDIRRGVLDPLGSRLEHGSDLYIGLLTELTESLLSCLQRG